MKIYCPKCSEGLSLREYLRHWLYMITPQRVLDWRDRRIENDIQSLLLQHYNKSANLTPREHIVCANLAVGIPMEYVAADMNVTRERVRQIRNKAVRKMMKKGDSE